VGKDAISLAGPAHEAVGMTVQELDPGPAARERCPGRGHGQVAHLADRPDDAPYEWTVTLAVDPRVEVVADKRERETHLLGPTCITYEVERRMLLARKRVPDFHGWALPTEVEAKRFRTRSLRSGRANRCRDDATALGTELGTPNQRSA